MIFNPGGNKEEATEGDIFADLGTTGKYIKSQKILHDYKKNPEKYTTTRKADFSQLKDENLIDLNSFWESSYSAHDAILSTWRDLPSFFGSLSEETQERLQPMWDSVENGSATVGDLLEGSLENIPDVIDNVVSQAQNNVDSITAKFKEFGLGILSGGLNMVASIAATALLSKLLPIALDALDNIFNHSDRLIRKGEEARQEIDNIYDSIEKGNKEITDIAISVNIDKADQKNVKDNLEAIADKYVELKKGVNDFTNANKSLTTDQYEEYLTLCNKLAEKYPELVKGYDSQGNAILRLGDTSDECRQELIGLYDQALKISNLEMSENLETAFAGFIEKIKVARTEIEDCKTEILGLEEQIKNLKDETSGKGLNFDEHGTWLSFSGQGDFEEFLNKFRDSFNEWSQTKGSGASWDDQFVNQLLDMTSENMTADGRYKVYIPVDVETYFQTVNDGKEGLNDYINETVSDMEVAVKEANDQIVLKTREILAEEAKNTEKLKQALMADDVFTSLNSAIIDVVLGNLGQFDTKYITDKFGEDGINDFVDYIVSVLGSITDETMQKIEKVLNKDYSNMDLGQYMDALYKGIFNATGNNKELTSQLYELLNIPDQIGSYLDKRTEIFNVLEPLGMTEEQLANLDLSEIDKGLEIIRGGLAESLSSFYEQLHQDVVEEAPKEGIFADILNDESYQDLASEFQKKLTALNTAAEALKEKGSLYGSDLQAVLDEGVDLGGDYSLDAINDKSLDYLSQWVKLLYEQADAKELSEKGMSNLNDYVRGLIEQYQELDVSAEKATLAIRKSVYGHRGELQYEAVMKQFEAELGTEEGRRILFYLAADPSSATWEVEEWRDKFDKTTITFDLVAETAKLDKAIEERAGKRNVIDAQNSLKEVTSGPLAKEDYDVKIKLDLEDEQDFYQKYINTMKELQKAREEYGKSKNTDKSWKEQSEALEKQARERWTDYVNAQQQTMTDRLAQQNAPLEELKQSLTDIQTQSAKVQTEIAKLEKDGKSATSSQYKELIGFSKDEIANLEQQQTFYEGLKLWLTGEGFDEKSTEYTNADAALQQVNADLVTAQSTLDETQAKLDKVYSSASFEYLLTNTDSEKGVRQIYATFDEFIKKYQGYIDQIKNGEKVDLSSMVLDVPELSGVINTTDALQRLGELKADAVLDFAEKFGQAVSEMDHNSQGFKDAIQFMITSLTDIDFSEMDVDTLYEKIQLQFAKLSGVDVQKKGELYKVFEDAINSGDPEKMGLVLTVSMLPQFLNMTPEEAVEVYNNLELMVDLKVDSTEFEKKMAEIESRLAQLQSQSDYIEAQRNYAEQTGDHSKDEQFINDDIRNTKEQMRLNRIQRDTLYDENNENSVQYKIKNNMLSDESGKVDSQKLQTAIRDRVTEVTKLDTAYTNLEATLHKLEIDKILLPAQEFDRAIEKLETDNKEFMTELNSYDEYTAIPLEVFSNVYNNLSDQAEQYQLKRDFYQTLLNSEEFKNVLDETTINWLESESAAIGETIQGLQEQMSEILEDEVTDEQLKEISRLNSEKAVLQAQQKDKKMTKADYEELDAIDAQIEAIYTELVNKFTTRLESGAIDPKKKGALSAALDGWAVDLANIISERTQNGYSKEVLDVMDDEAILESLQNYGNKIKDQIADIQEAGTEIVPDSMYTQLELNANAQLKQIEKIKEAWLELARTTDDDTKKKEYADNARAMDSAKDSAETDKRTGEEGKEENKLTKLETEATKVDNALEKIRKKINDSSKFTTLDDYNAALEESGNKLNNLAEQEAYWSDMLSSGVEEGSADWQTYSSNLKQVQDEIEATKEEQEAWNKAIDNFDADSIQRELDDYNKALNDLQNNIKMNEAKGIEKSSADYAAENELYDNIEKAAKSRADELQKNLTKDIEDHVIQENSADYFAAMQEIDSATQEAFNAAYSRVQNEHEEELLPINQLQDELGKLQVVGSEIQREFDNITAAGGEISDVQYSKQVDNLEDQREILELIADEYEKLATKHQNDSFGLEMMQALDGVQSQIDAINDQEIDIQFQIDNRPLRHLQNEMTNLETEANKLKTQLDNTTTASGKETIINKILGNNEEQKSNLAQQIAEYRDQMKQIEDSYKGTENEQGYLTNSKYVDLVANIVSAENSMEGLIQSTIDYKKALENLPIERINKSVELNDARLNRAQSEISIKEASGDTVTKEDYSPILRAYEEDVRLKEESLRIATEAFNNAKHDYEEAGTEENLEAMQNANTGLINAQTELNNAEATLIKSQEEASNAALNAHDVRIRELQARKDEIEMAQGINEASGVKRSKADIQNDYGMVNKFRKEYEAELETFNNEHPGELTIDQLEQKLAIQKNINSAEQESLQYIKEILEYDANQGQNVLEELEEDASRLDAGIAEIQRKGLEVPDVTFDLKISNIEEQKEQVTSLIDIYQGLMDKYGEEHPEWFEGWDDIIEGLRSKLQSLDSELNQTQEEKDNKSLTHLGYQLDDLKVKGEELQKVLNKEGSPKFISDYEKAIQNVVQQNQNLSEQAQELQTKMQGLNFNDPKYQEYKGQLDGIRSAQEANIETIREWQKELDMLSFNKASESLNKYIEEMNKGLEKQDNRVALGYRLTKDDLESNRAQYLHSQESARRNAQNASAEMDKLERENPYSFWLIPRFQDLQEQYDAAVALEEEYKQKVEETNKEIVLFPVEELKREQEDIQRSYEDIERTIVELKQKGMEAPEGLVNQQMDIIDEETANLEEQIEKLEIAKIFAEALGLEDFADNIQDMIDDVRNQIHSLADEKYELKIDLDQRSIEGYENKLKELEGYADLLQDSYDNPETASVSKDEALVRLKANAEQRKQIILDEIKYYRGELQKVLEVDPEATYATNDLYRENQDMINQLILKYNDVTRSVKEYGDAIKNLPVNRLQEQLDNFGIRRSGLEAKNSVISALGGQEDMSGLLTIDSAATDITQRVVGEYKKRMEEAEQQLRQDTGSSIYGYLEEEYRKAVNEYFQKVNEFNSQQVQEINDRLAAGKQPITALENEMDVIKNKAASVQNEANRLVESGATASEAQYNALIKYNDQEIENIENQKAAWEDYRQVVIALLNEFGVSAENSPLLNEIDAQINQLNMDTQALIDSTLEYELMLNGGRELAILSERMKELENEFSNINEEISNMESLGQNIPTKMYDGLIKNSRQQVYNLQSQNEYLRQQQNLVGDNKAKYAELEDQIRSNDSTIRGLLTNIDNYHNSIAHFATNAAAALSSAVESALSESMSSTGLSNDTMNALMTQFKQLESVSNIDLRSMFIQSANGIQVNISALRKLIKAQGSLTKSNFANQVRVQNNELVRQVRAYKNTSNAANQDGRVKRNAAKQNLQGIKKEVKALDVEMNAYYALQKMMEERTSGYQKWQNALQTPNAGDHYKEVYSQMESITQALNMGEVGTDEWISFWRDYVSREGRHSSEYAREQWVTKQLQ